MDARKLSAIVLALTLSLTMFGGCLDDDGPRIPTNEAPVADVQGPATGYVGEELTFNASGSADDEDAESLSYVWEFEEGVLLIQMGPVVAHTYSEPGTYTVNVTVTDSEGAEDTASMTVIIHQKLTIQLSSPSVTQHDRGNTCWDAILNINRMTPKDKKVQWTEITIVIKDSDGNILNDASTVAADEPTAYTNPVTGSTTDVEFWFVDITGDVYVGAGDAIKITGMDDGSGAGNDYQGALVESIYDDYVVGATRLPTDFP